MLNEVKVDKGKLLKALRDNKKKHVGEYESAVVNYRAEAEKQMRKRAIEIRDEKTLSTRIDLPEPQTFEADYERAIQMVTWSTDDVIELSEHDFRSFVLDEWEWRARFAGTTSVYNNR